MELGYKFTKVTLVSKILALMLFVSLPFAGVYVGMKYQKSITVPNVYSCTQKADTCLLQDKSAKITGTYIDEVNRYRIEIPSGWTAKKDRDGQLVIQSGDLVTLNEGYGLPIQGAEVLITNTTSEFSDIKEVTKDLAFGIKGGWILNLRNMTIDGNKSIQYEWAWEGYGTETTFIKDGKQYSFVMYYNPDQKSNTKYLETYNQMLKTIKVL